MPEIQLTEEFVKSAKPEPGKSRTYYWQKNRPGFGLMVTATGHKSFIVQYRPRDNPKQTRRITIPGTTTFKKAEAIAIKRLDEVSDGKDPYALDKALQAAQADTVQSVADRLFVAENKKKEGERLRSLDERKAIYRRYIKPRFEMRAISSLARSEIMRMFKEVTEKNGPRAAEHAVGVMSWIMKSYEEDTDDFHSPIKRGMFKSPKVKGKRILSDNELRVMWFVASSRTDPYANMLRLILLTATRLREASDANRSERSKDGKDWIIPASRYKTKRDHVIPLSRDARDLLDAMPVIGNEGWIFTTNGKAPISGFSKNKRNFDDAVLAELRKSDPDAKPLPKWTTHDLRRTARSLLSRKHLRKNLGVPPHWAEQVLGHVIPGVEGVYDQHNYYEEKAEAFEALAEEVCRIVGGNVVPMMKAAS